MFSSRRSIAAPPATGTLVVLSRDKALFRALAVVCERLGVRCVEAQNPDKFAQGPDAGDVLAVVWDARAAPPDLSQLENAAGEKVVITVGLPPSVAAPQCPAPLDLPGDLAPEVAAGIIAAALEGALAKRKVSGLEQRLEEAQDKIDEHVTIAKALKEHIELYDLQRGQLAEVVRRTAYLGQLSKELNCLDIDKIMDICVTKASKLVDATLASVYVLNEESSELALRRTNHSRRIAERIPMEGNPPSLMALACDKKAVLLIKDIDAFAKRLGLPVDRTYADRYRTHSCIVVPLLNDNRVIAVLNLADKANGSPFDEVRDLPLMDHVSQFIGIALRNCQLYDQVWHLAKTDALTGFINHKAFFDELKREMDRVSRNKSNLSLILLDVDNFKLFNDVHGHQVGDMVLRQVAQLIRNNVRTIDVAARYGGDEFAIILADTDLQRAEMVAERIRRAIAANQLTLNVQTFFVTISAGVTQLGPGQTLADIVSDADAALYRAKSRGRNAIAVSGK